MSGLKYSYDSAEGWLALGNLQEAEQAFQELPSRAVMTRRGLRLWLKLSHALQRWPEVAEAARLLRQSGPLEPELLLAEAEALHAQNQTLSALALLSSHAPNFIGKGWHTFVSRVSHYLTAAKSKNSSVASLVDGFPPLEVEHLPG